MPHHKLTDLVKSLCCFGFFFDVVLYTHLRSLRYSPLLAEIYSLPWTDTHHDGFSYSINMP